MIVQIDFGAGQVLNEEERLMDRAKGPVHEHLDRHTRGRIETFHLRRPARARQLRFIEVAQQLAG